MGQAQLSNAEMDGASGGGRQTCSSNTSILKSEVS